MYPLVSLQPPLGFYRRNRTVGRWMPGPAASLAARPRQRQNDAINRGRMRHSSKDSRCLKLSLPACAWHPMR